VSATPVTLEAMLRGSVWASALTADELDRVVRESFERHIATGGYAARIGEPCEYWIGVMEGLVKMSISQPDGRLSTFTGAPAGGWAGEGTLLRGSRWGYDAVAVRPTRIACVPRHTFERLASTSLPFTRFLLSHINARLSLFISLAEYDRLLGPEERVARCIASLFDPDLYPTTGDFVSLNQEEVGLLSKMSRQRANQALHALERAGLLKLQFGGLTVLDLPGLRCYRGQPANSKETTA
jgi:CRP/FNR family cyclic AMP-dependent transcriptional regulator